MPGVNIVTAADRVFQEFRTDLLAARDAAPRIWPEYAMQIPSSSRSTLHAWLANQSSVREWIGPRQYKGMSTRSWEVVNKKWELSFEFSRDQIEDDLSGLSQQAVMNGRAQGVKWARHEDLYIAQTLEAGISSLCYDGQFFFDTDHPIDPDGVTSGTFDNDLALALSHANYSTALETMMGFKNEDGSPMIMPGGLVLMVPPALATKAKQILEIDMLTPDAAYGVFGNLGASRNPFMGSAKVVVNPYLSESDRWYLLAGGEVLKPIMFQVRRPLEVSEMGPGSSIYFEEEKIRIGGSARYEVSYTLPQLALTSKP